MLKQNKALVVKSVLFLAVLVFGGVMLFSSRDRDDDYIESLAQEAQDYQTPSYNDGEPSEADTDEDYTQAPPARQPIAALTGPFICQCADEYIVKELEAPRARSEGVQVKSIQTLHGTNMLLEADGSLWSWGSSWTGQLGRREGLQHSAIPAVIMEDVVYVAEGGYFAITNTGCLWGWGAQVSQHGILDSGAPRFLLSDVSTVFTSRYRDFALRTNGSLYAFRPRRDTLWDQFGRRIMSDIINIEVEITHVLDSVVGVYSTTHRDFILQCNGNLWYITDNTDPYLIMGGVQAVFPPIATDLRGGRRVVFVKQTDNSLWSIVIAPRGGARGELPAPEHVLDDVSDVVRGNLNDFFIQTDGSLWGKGHNNSGQLGIGDRNRSEYPVFVMGDIANVYTHDARTFAITTQGALYAWGENERGMLGIGSDRFSLYPRRILDGVAYVRIGTQGGWGGSEFALGVNGEFWKWGMYWTDSGHAPSVVDSPRLALDSVREFHAFGSNTLVVDNSGNLYAWLHGSGTFWVNEQAVSPVHLLDSVIAVYVDSDFGYGFIMRNDGSIWAMGNNDGGRLGDGTHTFRPYPVNISYAFSYAVGSRPRILGHTPVDAIERASHSLPFVYISNWEQFFIDENGWLWSWGFDLHMQGRGMLGRSTNPYDLNGGMTPGIVMGNVVYVSSQIEAYAIREDGSLWEWGTEDRDTPEYVMGQIASIYMAYPHVFALGEDGVLWYWRSAWARYGLEWWDSSIFSMPYQNTVSFREPMQVMENVASLYMSSGAFFALKQDGDLWSWGESPVGLRGDGNPPLHIGVGWPSISLESLPEPTLLMPNIARFYVFEQSAFAITRSGSLWAWGNNSHGQLGDGTRISRYAPVYIMDGVLEVFSDGTSTFASRADGSLWGWGWNVHGQLGDGTNLSRLTPVQIMVTHDSGWVSPEGVRFVIPTETFFEAPRAMYFSAGTVFAIQGDNSLWAWGIDISASPVHVMDDVDKLLRTTRWDWRGSEQPIYALQTDGNLWDLGAIQEQDTGLSEPELIATDIMQVTSSGGAVIAVTMDNQVLAWGTNWNNRLAEGDELIPRDAPVRIVFE